MLLKQILATQQKHSYLKYRNENLHLTMCDKELEMIRKNKYLGVVIDNSLNWKEYIKSVSAKVSEAIGFLRHPKQFLQQETYFRNCCSVWGCAGSTEMNQLQKLQHRGARMLTNSSFGTPSIPLIDMLGFNPLSSLLLMNLK